MLAVSSVWSPLRVVYLYVYMNDGLVTFAVVSLCTDKATGGVATRF